MGITDSEAWKKWQKFNKEAEDTPALFLLADALGVTGEGGWMSEKLPEMWKSYDTQKDFADYGVEMTPEDNPVLDYYQRSMNLASDVSRKGLNVADEWLNAIELGLESAGDLIYDTTKWGPGRDKPQGIGGLKTYWSDVFGPWGGPLTNGKGSGMMEESREIIGSYAAPENLIDEFNQLDLGKWSTYQNWKKGSGWDSADDRKINKKVKKEMDKMDFGHDAMWPQFLELAKVPGNEKILESEEAINFYYDNMVNDTKKYTSEGLRNEFEFEETGNDYGKWASHKSQNELLNKYGRYPLADGLNHLPGEMSFNLSPWGEENMSSMFNLANDDYINALKEGKSGMTPTEWDYGLFDDDSSVGIDETFSKDLFDYTTPEAKEFMDANQMTALEFIAGGSGILKTPKILNRLQRHPIIQNTKAGRYAREFAPGLLQWGKRDKFGIPKFKDNTGFLKFLNYGIRGVDFARPKGLQFAAAAATSELMDRD